MGDEENKSKWRFTMIILTLLYKFFLLFTLLSNFGFLYPQWQETLTSQAKELVEQMQESSCIVRAGEDISAKSEEQLHFIFDSINRDNVAMNRAVQNLEVHNEQWNVPHVEFYGAEIKHFDETYRVADCMGSQELFNNIMWSAKDILNDKTHALYPHILKLLQTYIAHDEEFVEVFKDTLQYELDDETVTKFFDKQEVQEKYKKTYNRFFELLTKRIQDSDGSWKRVPVGHQLAGLKLNCIFSAIPGSFASAELLKSMSELYESVQKHYVKEYPGLAWFFPNQRNSGQGALSFNARQELVARTLQLFMAKDSWLMSNGEENFSCTINFLPLNLCKKFPQAHQPFKSSDINSALYSHTFNLLTIYRAEEALKLLTHEFLHRIDFDSCARAFSEEDEAKVVLFRQKYAFDKKNSRGNQVPGADLFEALTEAGASFLNIIFIASNQEDSVHAFKQMWEFEKSFSMLQVAKILHLSGFSSFEEFCNAQQTDKRIEEWTSAVEYHIFKAALLENLEWFMQAFIRRTPDQKSLTLDDVIQAIDTGMQSVTMTASVNALLEKLQQNHFDTDSLLVSTGRMTLIEQAIE